MLDIRQTDEFARFMSDLGWDVNFIGNTNIFLRKLPVIGYFAKIGRPSVPFSIPEIIKFSRKKHLFKIKIAPDILTYSKFYQSYSSELAENKLHIEYSPFNPTLDIKIDLNQTEKQIFDNFTQAKRRAVRRAWKYNIMVKESDDFDSFIKIRKKQYSPMGFLFVSEMKKLWNNFFPGNSSLLLAFDKEKKPVAGIYMPMINKIAYYWYASALVEGKKMFAPSLLVWEALKLAKKKNCHTFMFEGIYDDRFKEAAKSWKGFTKFKEGFGGEKVVYMENYST